MKKLPWNNRRAIIDRVRWKRLRYMNQLELFGMNPIEKFFASLKMIVHDRRTFWREHYRKTQTN